MVGIVIVSHSATLAKGVVELAREMGGPEVALEPAGGTTLPDAPLGTDAALVMEAIERAQSGDGVLVLMDLGSAVLSAEMALDLLGEGAGKDVLLCEAPLVEGAVAAATAARIGRDLEAVAAEARGGIAPKAAHLGTAEPGAQFDRADSEDVAAVATDGLESIELEVTNRLGLHARPAARFVRAAAGFDAAVTVENVTTGAGPANGQSLNALATLGVRRGHRVLVTARGPGAADAVAAIRALARDNFGDAPDESEAAPARPLERAQVAEGTEVPDGAIIGLPASGGIAIGPARAFMHAIPKVSTRPPQAPDEEWARLEKALDEVRADIRKTRDDTATRLGEEHAEIFDAHLLMLDDDSLIEPARRAIHEGGRNASEAWNEAVGSATTAFRNLDDEYLAARGDDVQQVGAEVLRRVQGEAAGPSMGAPGVIVAHELSPADAASLDPHAVWGFVTATGGPTSHSAILARALGVPAVVGAGDAVDGIPDGATVVLDGDEGFVLVDPRAEVEAAWRTRLDERRGQIQLARDAAHAPAVTTDGTRIEVVANIGAPQDVAGALDAGAEGVGLLRTEFLYLDRAGAPDEDEQYATLRDIASRLEGKPVIVRTLDAGADKPLPFLHQPPEANPFLGVRGVRLGLAHPDILRTQLRAIARVALEFPVRIMFPMVANLDEFQAANSMLKDEARKFGVTREQLATGIMVEVPAAALCASAFAPVVDFFSIGTNDLSQYTVAADRGNEAVAGMADALHPAVLRLIAEVTESAAHAGKWVGVCGELAGDPLAAPILVGLGVRELSMSAPSIPLVKSAVRSLDLSRAQSLAGRALQSISAADVRALVVEDAGIRAEPSKL